MTGARHLAKALEAYDVSHVFFVPAVLLKTLAEMEDMAIARIMTHGEKAAAYMADGYARASGKPGICFAQNIGASNLAAGLRDAYMAGAPMIAITGGPTPSSRYRGYYQEIEDFAQFDPVTKLNLSVDHVSRLPDLLRQAFRVATSGSPGPVHLRLQGVTAEDLMDGEADLPVVVDDRCKCAPASRPAADLAQVDEVARLLGKAARPIIVAGGGVITSGAQVEVMRLADLLQIPVATSLNAKETIRDDHPLAVGVVGTYSRSCANKAVSEADLVVFIGSRTGGQVTARWTIPSLATPVIHLDIDPARLGRNYPHTTPLLGDAKFALLQLIEKLGPSPPRSSASWVGRVQQLVAAWREEEKPALGSSAVPMRPERLCQAVSNALPENGVLVSDTGHAGIWSGTLIDLRKPGQRYIRCAGSLGWALPAAIGVKCALPDHPVVCFAGDGAAYYHIAELETAARYGINVVFVVNNNNAMNQEMHLYDHAYGGKMRGRAGELWRFTNVNMAAVAKSFNCVGMRVQEPDDIEGALKEALALDKPVVIDAVTDVHAVAKGAWVPPP
jgi:acetolactate synthase I/II/III large subunit